MPYANEIAARINSPGKYKRFRRDSGKMGAGVDVIWGVTEDGKVEVQAIRFDAGRFSPEQAREWLKEHNYTAIEFERATSPDRKMGELVDLADLYLDNEYDDVDGVEVLNTFWNTKGVKFDAATFDEFIQNFEKYKGEKHPHVKIDHTSQQAVLKALTGEQFEEGTELPNLGFLKRMYHNGKALYADFTKVPRKLKDVVFGGKMFKAISPEATWNYRGTGDKLITAFALTNNPSQKHILDVHMNESTTDTDATGEQGGTVLRFSGDILINEGGDNMADTMKTQDATAAAPAQITDSAMESFSEKVAEKVKAMFGKKEDKTQAASEPVIALSEYKELEAKTNELAAKINDLGALLIQKESESKNFSERVKAIEQATRIEKAEAICKKALMDGVPKVVIEHFKPILLSEMGEQTIKLSETVNGKTVEADKAIVELIKDFFAIYPDKVDFSERTKTKVEEPGMDEDVKLSEINKLASEYVKQGMARHEALEKAGLEVLSKQGR